MAFRDKDTSSWTGKGRTLLDQRHYSLLNWRSNVVVIVTDTDPIVQHVRYNDSGSPPHTQSRISADDVKGNGIVDAIDTGTILSAIGGAYIARYDLNFDVTVDADRKVLA